jgi:hypothetical protein
MYCEGILEHFFSKHLSAYFEGDMQWYLNFLAKPNPSIIGYISSDVAKFFLKRVLTIHEASSAENILRLFDDEVSFIAVVRYQFNSCY